MHRLSVAHSQRVSQRWPWTASLRDCRDFRHGASERRDGGKVFQVCTMQCGNARRTKLGVAVGSYYESWKACQACTR